MRAAAVAQRGASRRPVNIESYTVYAGLVSVNTYDFPPRIRGIDPSRRRIVVRNLGTTSIQVAYGVGDNFSNPVSGQWVANPTIAAGQEWVEETADPWGLIPTAILFVRPFTRGDGLLVGVNVRLGVI